MPELSIPYASLTVPQLVTIHNTLAAERGHAPLKSWHDSHCRLAERVAILRTHKKLPPEEPKRSAKPRKAKKRKQPLRDAILKALAIVSHYEDAKTGDFVSKGRKRNYPRPVIAVGLPYCEVMAIVRRQFPRRRFTPVLLRVCAARVRSGEPGYSKCKLPAKRPHGNPKGV